MKDKRGIVVTDIKHLVTVYSQQGRYEEIKNRPSYGLSFCISGQITYTMNGKKFVSDSNSAVLLPMGKSYSLRGDTEGFFPVINFTCENFVCDEITVISLENPQLCIKNYDKMKSLFLFKENRLKLYSVFYEILNQVFSVKKQGNAFINQAIKYIEQNLSSQELTNTTLAKHCGISEVYLRRLFLSAYNITPKQYIIDVRMEKAKTLLIDTNNTVTAIAEECGFSGLYHFCRAFKNSTGITPTEYAKQNKVFGI